MAASHAKSKAPLPEPTFYQASNRIGSDIFIWLPIVGGSCAVVVGTAYAFIAGFVREIEHPWFLLIVTPMLGALLGALGQWVCQLSKVRRRALRKPIIYLVAAMTFYWAWHAYLNF